MKKYVTGIGGIFYKVDDPAKSRDWYQDNLGLVTNDYGAVFEFRTSDSHNNKGYANWSPMPIDTDYFNPSGKDFMINLRVKNIEELVNVLKKKGIEILDEITTYDYGKFVHILDLDGNNIELWEPFDSAFEQIYPDTEVNK